MQSHLTHSEPGTSCLSLLNPMPKTQITIWNNDAIEVNGDFNLQDNAGNQYRQHGKVRLCRCGQSNKKPYCDNSHIRTGFQSTVTAPQS